MTNIFEEIMKERARQDEKWGIQSHQPIVWSAILQEEAGEVAKAALEELFDTDSVNIEEYREELIQTAAVCVAAIQCLDEGYADSSSKSIEPDNGKWKPLGVDDNWLESETGILYEFITHTGKVFKGYAMDWGVVPEGEDEVTLEEMGENIIFFRKLSDG